MNAPHPLKGLLYEQAEFARLCAERPLDWDEYAHMNEFHGNASILKRYAGLPLDEPVPFAIEHAIPYDLDSAYDYDLNCGLPLFLAVREESAALYRGGPIPQVCSVGFTHLYAMDLFARMHPQVEDMPRRGTIVFPDKSTLLMDTDFDRDAFAAKLAALPAEFQPVVVCIYWRDVLRGTHAAYERTGLPLVTCGHLRDGDFLLRFHDLCRRFRYACANDIAGSFVLSILSGCHFFHLPGGPIAQSKHGRTGTFERDPTLDKPKKSACLAAAPFPPTSSGPQQALTRQLAGVAFKKSPQEIAALHAEARQALRRAVAPMRLTLDAKTPPGPWHRLLPVGIDRDGWLRREARLHVARSTEVAAARLTLNFWKAPTSGAPVAPLQIEVQGKPFATLQPAQSHQEILVPCDPEADETVIRFTCSHVAPVPGESRQRALHLSRVELLGCRDAAEAEAAMPCAAQKTPRSGGLVAPESIKLLLDRDSLPASSLARDPDLPMTTTSLPSAARLADLNGLRLKRPDHPAVYFVDGGVKRLIPNPETFNNVFRDWNGIITDLPLDEIPDGPMLSHGAALVRPANSEMVYLIDRGTKRAISGAGAMERYHFNEKKVTVVPPILTDLLPNGKPLSVPGTAA